MKKFVVVFIFALLFSGAAYTETLYIDKSDLVEVVPGGVLVSVDYDDQGRQICYAGSFGTTYYNGQESIVVLYTTVKKNFYITVDSPESDGRFFVELDSINSQYELEGSISGINWYILEEGYKDFWVWKEFDQAFWKFFSNNDDNILMKHLENGITKLMQDSTYEPPTTSPCSWSTQTPTLTPTKTPSFTATPTLTAVRTLTKTPTITRTPTPEPTVTKTPVNIRLWNGEVKPEKGYQDTLFEYSVNYEGSGPAIKRLFVNGNLDYRIMDKKSSEYSCSILGSELKSGNNEFYFLFVDNEGNNVRLPATGSYDGPVVEVNLPTPEPTPTITQTSTPEPTLTPTITPTPIETPTPPPYIGCLRVASRSDFSYNTIALAWTPIEGANFYLMEFVAGGGIVKYIHIENNLTITVATEEDWEKFVELGTIWFRVTAYEEETKVIEGPTDWTTFLCLPVPTPVPIT